MTSDHKRLIEAAKNPSLALDYEIAQEMASALGRHGRALEKALQALADFDTASSGGALPDARRALVATAGHALWQFIQRSATRDAKKLGRAIEKVLHADRTAEYLHARRPEYSDGERVIR